MYTLHVPAVGIPAYSPTHGSLGWSSVAVLVDESEVVVIDTGGPGYRARWDGWLAGYGLDRGDVTAVLLTHCHWDHVGSTLWFPRADVCVPRADLAWALDHGAGDPHVEPGLVAALRAHRRLHPIDDGENIRGVTAIATPGHTPGHTSYHAPTRDGPTVVVGDAVKNGHELRTGQFAMAADPRSSTESLAVIHALADQGSRILLGHDGVYTAGAVGPAASFAPSATVEAFLPATGSDNCLLKIVDNTRAD